MWATLRNQLNEMTGKSLQSEWWGCGRRGHERNRARSSAQSGGRHTSDPQRKLAEGNKLAPRVKHRSPQKS